MISREFQGRLTVPPTRRTAQGDPVAVDYSVTKGHPVCSQSGQELLPGETCYSALLENDEGFERRDFSPAAWEGQDPSTFFSYWRPRVATPEEKKKLVVDVEAFYTFFAQLAGEADPRRVLFRYFVALILVRRRVLRLDAIEKGADGDELLLFDRRTQEEVRVGCPPADRSALDEVQQQLEQIFDCQVGLDDL